MKDKSELIEEMVNKITIESTKKIIEGVNLELINLSDKKFVFLKIGEFDKDIGSKLDIIYKSKSILNQEELKEHISNIIKIRAINRTRRIDLGNTENLKRRSEWKKLLSLVEKIEKIYSHYDLLPKQQRKMTDDCINNVKKQLLIMSIKEQDEHNISIKDSILKKLTIINK